MLLYRAADIEDLPVNIKKYAKKSQDLVRNSIPAYDADTGENDPHDVWKLLYKAHVQVITHGAVLCGESPLCSECPLQSQCDYGRHHYVPRPLDKTSKPDSMRVMHAYEVLDTALGPRKDGDVVPWLLLAGLHYGTGEVEGTVLVSSWTAFDVVTALNSNAAVSLG